MYGVGKRRALLLPIVFPAIREKTSSTYIGRFKEHLYTVLSSLQRASKKLWGSFAVLYKDYQSCSVVFIDPTDVFRLGIKALGVIRERVQELRSDIHELSYFARKVVRECAEDLSKCGLYVYSKYVADVVVKDIALFVSKKDVYYCAGHIVKTLKKIDADGLLERSIPVAKTMDIIDIMAMHHTALNRLPFFQYAVIVDKSSKNISMLNPLSAQFLDVCDIEELRVYDTNTTGVMILVAKRVDPGTRSRCYSLFDYLASSISIRPAIDDDISAGEIKRMVKELMPGKGGKCIDYPWAEKYQEVCEKAWDII